MEEIWKDVVGYENFYSVSNYGRIWSKRRDKEISVSTNNCGYKQFIASDGNNTKCVLVHRAVAMAFLKNIENLPVINHKDENPSNNIVDNLEWCTISYNAYYNNVRSRKNKYKKTVYQYSMTGDLIEVFESTNEASKTLSISNGDLCQCCNGSVANGKKSYTLHNFVFSYKELTRGNVLDRFLMSNYCKSNKKNNKGSKKVLQFSLDESFIQEYPSVNEIERMLGFSGGNIAACCRGKFKQMYGYMWKYKEQ
jgi:hypothetical protein